MLGSGEFEDLIKAIVRHNTQIVIAIRFQEENCENSSTRLIVCNVCLFIFAASSSFVSAFLYAMYTHEHQHIQPRRHCFQIEHGVYTKHSTHTSYRTVRAAHMVVENVTLLSAAADRHEFPLYFDANFSSNAQIDEQGPQPQPTSLHCLAGYDLTEKEKYRFSAHSLHKHCRFGTTRLLPPYRHCFGRTHMRFFLPAPDVGIVIRRLVEIVHSFFLP